MNNKNLNSSKDKNLKEKNSNTCGKFPDEYVNKGFPCSKCPNNGFVSGEISGYSMCLE